MLFKLTNHLRFSFSNCIHLLLSYLNYMHIVSYIYFATLTLSPLEFFRILCIYIYTHIYTHTHVFNFLERSRRTGGFIWIYVTCTKYFTAPHEFLFPLSLPKENLSIRVSTKCWTQVQENRQYLYSISPLFKYRRWITDLDER